MRNFGVKLKIFTRIVGSILGGALAFPRQRIVFYIPVALLAACVCSFEPLSSSVIMDALLFFLVRLATSFALSRLSALSCVCCLFSHGCLRTPLG